MNDQLTALPVGALINGDDHMLVDDSAPTANPVKITATDLILDEIRMAIKVTQHFDELIKNAKTTTKKAFYRKKMVANNEFIMKALVMLDQYKKVSDAADQQKVNEDNLDLVKRLASESMGVE